MCIDLDRQIYPLLDYVTKVSPSPRTDRRLISASLAANGMTALRSPQFTFQQKAKTKNYNNSENTTLEAYFLVADFSVGSHDIQIRREQLGQSPKKIPRRGFMRFFQLLLFALATTIGSGSLGGCTTVHVHGATIDTLHSTHLRLSMRSELRSSTIVVTRGIGIVLGQRSATIGYLDETMVLIPPDSECQTFIFVKNNFQLDKLRAAIKAEPAFNHLCFLSPGAIHDP